MSTDEKQQTSDIAYEDYIALAETVLEAAEPFLEKRRRDAKYQWLRSAPKGRATSEDFDKHFVTDVIGDEETHKELRKVAVAAGEAKGLKLVFDRIVPSDPRGDNKSSSDSHVAEGRRRSYTDLTIEAHEKTVPTNEYEIPVNVKFTSDSSADNLCGWRALSDVMFSGKKPQLGSSILKQISEGKHDLSYMRDYLIWSFKHGDDKELYSGKPRIFSLLGPDPTEFSFNASQSFPVQGETSKLAGKFRLDKDITIEERKKGFVKWLIQSSLKDRAKKQALEEAALEALM